MRLYGLCKTERLGALVCWGPSIQTVSKALATSRRTASVCLFSPKFLVIISTRWASCKDVLCLGLNPNCSSRITPRSLTSCKILANSIFSNSLPIVSKRQIDRQDEGSAGFFPILSIEITRACFHTVGK
jgi:hypothetical protein